MTTPRTPAPALTTPAPDATAPVLHQVPTPGTALWVSAHPHADSLNGALTRAGVEELSTRREVATSDLYAQGFDPALRPAELGPLGERALSDEVREEQRKLASAELLILQFPLWWYGTPAILKGWLDRVLTEGFAYGDLDPELGVPRRYGDGGLAGRRALVVVSAGEDANSIGPRGISGDLDAILFPLTHGTLWYVGIEVLDLHVITDADGLDPAAVARETDRLRARVRGLDEERPVPYRRLRDGEYAGTRALREDLLPGRTDLAIHRR